jgi:hypothetical protein
LTNGEVIEVWQMQIAQESKCVLKIGVTSLADKRGDVEQLLSKIAIREYCRSLVFKTIVEATADLALMRPLS